MQHTGLAFLHMELNVESPVVAGDTIRAECEIVEARRSRSRPDRGLIRARIRVVKQDGAVALTYTPLRMVKCREVADCASSMARSHWDCHPPRHIGPRVRPLAGPRTTSGRDPSPQWVPSLGPQPICTR